MGIRRHLTYANVTATLALVLALGAGGAYAIDQIGSEGIRNDSILSEDLRDKRGVRGADVIADTLGRREVNERRLTATEIVPVGARASVNCDLGDSGPEACVTTAVRLTRRGTVVVIATGAFFGTGGDSRASCEVQVDGSGDPIGQAPGASTSATQTDGFARTIAVAGLSRGTHEASLVCEELGAGQATIGTPTITAFALTGR